MPIISSRPFAFVTLFVIRIVPAAPTEVPAKAPPPNVALGASTVSRLTLPHCANAFPPTSVTPFGMVTFDKPVQSSKADSPMEASESGKRRDCSDVMDKKARSPISTRVGGKVTLLSLLHPAISPRGGL